jgi:uncharacterized protein (DUF1501 family)|tara:strand:- start:137 stop:1297 length:1161 start_codon:yes stop_codon:yes gene_type:complete
MPNFKLSRRDFLKATGASLFLAGIPLQGYTKDKPPGNISVIILEGGMDGLTAVPPFGDPSLVAMRESIMSDKYLKLNSFFGLHSRLKTLSSLMAIDNASIVHATAFPYKKRSHFEGQDLMEGGGLSPFSQKTGWLGRSLELAKIPGSALSLNMPLILRGYSENDTYFPASIRNSTSLNASLIDAISKVHSKAGSDIFKKVRNKSRLTLGNKPRDIVSLAEYAGKAIAQKNGPVASVIRIPLFDSHAHQDYKDPHSTLNHGRNLEKFDQVLAAYKKGLGDAWDNSIILTLTEFGRTVKVNGSWGTDHGFASAGILAGGLISKARVIADWPGLSNSEQFEGRDLMSTIDYRSVCAACIERALGLDHDLIASEVFFDSKLPRIFDEIFS